MPEIEYPKGYLDAPDRLFAALQAGPSSEEIIPKQNSVFSVLMLGGLLLAVATAGAIVNPGTLTP